MFHTADNGAIKKGEITDVYFRRTVEILRGLGKACWVTAEVQTVSLPDNYNFAVLAGIEELATLLEGLPVEVEAFAEGSFFYPYEPVVVIRGRYVDFAIYETSLLGLLCQASGIATKAARCKKAAGERPVLSFGARRMHPAITPMIDRSAFIGGCDGVAVTKSAELLGIEPSGTIPHALILIMGSTVEAVEAFNRMIAPEVNRIALIDTFNDEKFEAVWVAEALGKDLFAVRLDTPGSRRGDFKALLEEVRWELDLRGFEGVKILVSGGLDEDDILQLNPVADAYGVGTALSNAPVINFALDLVEIDGRPIAKRGKRSGSKQVYQCQTCKRRLVVPAAKHVGSCSCGGEFEPLLQELIWQGKVVRELPHPRQIREFVLQQLQEVELNFGQR